MFLCSKKVNRYSYSSWQHIGKKSQHEIKDVVFTALQNNLNYDTQNILGIPASYLDDKVFNQDASFLKKMRHLFQVSHKTLIILVVIL